MSTNARTAIESEGRPRAGVSRSEPGGRAQRDAGGALAAGLPVEPLPEEVRERLSDELIDELLAGARGEEEIVGPGGLLADLTRRLVERAMDAELTEHLGYEHGQPPPGGAGNTRNGSTPKTLATEHGSVRIEAPRDRRGSFAPQIVPKGKRRFAGFDEKIIALYARGMTVAGWDGAWRTRPGRRPRPLREAGWREAAGRRAGVPVPTKEAEDFAIPCAG